MKKLLTTLLLLVGVSALGQGTAIRSDRGFGNNTSFYGTVTNAPFNRMPSTVLGSTWSLIDTNGLSRIAAIDTMLTLRDTNNIRFRIDGNGGVTIYSSNGNVLASFHTNLANFLSTVASTNFVGDGGGLTNLIGATTITGWTNDNGWIHTVSTNHVSVGYTADPGSILSVTAGALGGSIFESASTAMLVENSSDIPNASFPAWWDTATYGVVGSARGTNTTGANVGVVGTTLGRAKWNIGVSGSTQVTRAGTTNSGVFGAVSTGGHTAIFNALVGELVEDGFASDLVQETAVLLLDNRDTAAPLIIARSNGVVKFNVGENGNVTFGGVATGNGVGLTNLNLGSFTNQAPVTFNGRVTLVSNVFLNVTSYSTNSAASETTIDLSKNYRAFATNNNTAFSALAGIESFGTNVQSVNLFITNSSASVKTVTMSAAFQNMNAIEGNSLNLTNVGHLLVFYYPGFGTNFYWKSR